MLALNQYTTAERHEYLATISGAYGYYLFKTTVQVLNNQHGVISSVSHMLMDGQVDVEAVVLRDGNIEPSRTAYLQLLDPAHSLALDSSSPTDGALYLNRMIRIIVSVRTPSTWIDVPIFTGPITGVDRDGDLVNVNAAGKETFALRSAWETHTYKTGYKNDVLRALLVRAGETSKYMELALAHKRIAKPVVIARETKLWPKAFSLASSDNKILFYDARGIARTVPKTTKPVITFAERGLILSAPQVSFNTDELKNAAIVRGGDPKGPKKFVSATVVAPRSHPLSPFNIGRNATNGRGGFLTIREDNPNLRTTVKCVARANTLLKDSLSMQIVGAWDSLPVWHLEPWDMANVATAKFNGTIRVRKFSLPLVPTNDDAVMPVGYHRELTRPRVMIKDTAA